MTISPRMYEDGKAVIRRTDAVGTGREVGEVPLALQKVSRTFPRWVSDVEHVFALEKDHCPYLYPKVGGNYDPT
jgi:hypothetical protein